MISKMRLTRNHFVDGTDSDRTERIEAGSIFRASWILEFPLLASGRQFASLG
jgi:hypothetical protein